MQGNSLGGQEKSYSDHWFRIKEPHQLKRTPMFTPQGCSMFLPLL